MNGMFTSRSLAKVYAMLANGGEIDGIRILSRAAVQNMMQIQNRDPGKVIPLPMHWRTRLPPSLCLGLQYSTMFWAFWFWRFRSLGRSHSRYFCWLNPSTVVLALLLEIHELLISHLQF